MNTRERIFNLLADGDWHSGQDMAGDMGISRAAVWKQVSALQNIGLELHAVRGRGYRLSSPLELLRPESIKVSLDGMPEVDTKVLLSVDSTNRYVLKNADPGQPMVCFAEHQSAARGTRGRDWHSPFGGNLYMSVSWQFMETPPGLAALGLAVGTGIADYLRRHEVRGVGLKWPNDLLWQGRKLGGILIEHRGQSGGAWHVVVGVGLNYRMNPEAARWIDQPWVDLSTIASQAGVETPRRNALAGGLARSVLGVLQRFRKDGFAPFRESWAQFDVTRDQPVRVIQQGEELYGIARGISEEGALRVDSNGTRRSFVSGDVSLRLDEAVRKGA